MNRVLAALAAALISGCGDGGGLNAGGNIGIIDTVRPTVSYVTPTNNDAAVPNNLALSVTFSKPMDPGSLSSAITLVNTRNGSDVPLGDVTYDALNKIATVTPSIPLAGQDTYRAVVSTAATDLSGIGLADEYGWQFKTSGAVDTTPPTVTSVSPGDGTSGAPLSAGVAMSFSEAMNAGSLVTAFRLETGGTPVSGLLSYVGQAAVFTPNSPLAANTAYTATLGTAATDVAGNSLVTPFTWIFTTGAEVDTTPPRVVEVTPAPDAAGVSGDTPITVTFDSAIRPILFGTIDGFVTPITIDYSNNTVTVRPTTQLKPGVTYTSRINAADLAGNAMGEPYVWSFTIAP